MRKFTITFDTLFAWSCISDFHDTTVCLWSSSPSTFYNRVARQQTSMTQLFVCGLGHHRPLHKSVWVEKCTFSPYFCASLVTSLLLFTWEKILPCCQTLSFSPLLTHSRFCIRNVPSLRDGYWAYEPCFCDSMNCGHGPKYDLHAFSYQFR